MIIDYVYMNGDYCCYKIYFCFFEFDAYVQSTEV